MATTPFKVRTALPTWTLLFVRVLCERVWCGRCLHSSSSSSSSNKNSNNNNDDDDDVSRVHTYVVRLTFQLAVVVDDGGKPNRAIF